MNRRQQVVLCIEVILLLVSFAFPPYFGVDREFEGRVHGPVGYFPVWDPPSTSDVFEALVELHPELQNQRDRIEAFQPGLNKVKLTMTVTASLVVAGVLLYVFRERPAARQRGVRDK
jgi:hypothetical protein